MAPVQVIRILKRDELGRVELLDGPAGRVVRRVACGGWIPGSGLLARSLARRERRALQHMQGIEGVARALELPDYTRASDGEFATPAQRDVLLRSYVEGVPLHETDELALNFFDLLEDLVQQMHAQGVCHNDLHKEQNILVCTDGYPALLDFQLASIHEKRDRAFEKRVREDLRHLQKHRRRYTKDGRGDPGALAGAGHGLRRGFVARTWRALGKPLYNALVHGLGRKGASEPRRASSDPFPSWGPALEARSRRSGSAEI